MLDKPASKTRSGPKASGPRLDLQQHLADLEAAGLLVRIDRPINKDTELIPLVRWQFIGGMPEDQRRFEALTAQLAAAHHVPLFARGALMRLWESGGLPNDAVIGPDGLHHTDLGYDCVAAALADGIAAAIRPAAGIVQAAHPR